MRPTKRALLGSFAPVHRTLPRRTFPVSSEDFTVLQALSRIRGAPLADLQSLQGDFPRGSSGLTC